MSIVITPMELLEKARVGAGLIAKYSQHLLMFHPDILSGGEARLMQLSLKDGVWMFDSSVEHLNRLLDLASNNATDLPTLRLVETYELLHNLLHLMLLHWKHRGEGCYTNLPIYDIAADLHANCFIFNSDGKGASQEKSSVITAADQLFGDNGVLSMEKFPQYFSISFKEDVAKGVKGLQDLYDLLLKKEEDLKKKCPNMEQGEQEKGNGDGNGEGTPTNGNGEGNAGQNGNQGNAGQNQAQTLNDSEKRLKALLESNKKGQGRGHGQWSKLSKGEKSSQERLVAEAIQRALRSQQAQSNLPAGLREQIETWLENLTVDVDWKKHLMNALEKTLSTLRKTTIMRSSRRFADGKGSIAKRVSRVLVVIDTSGSMGTEDLNEAFNVLRQIQKRTKMKLYVTGCDAAVDASSVHEYNGGKLPTNLVGGGGTDFEPALQYGIKNQFNAIVYLTDGFCEPPKSQEAIKTIWVLTRNGMNKKEFVSNGFKGVVAKIR